MSEVERDIEALLLWVEARLPKRFDWRGSRDCVAFTMGAVEAQTGIDHLVDLNWRSRREALAVVKAEGGLIAALDKRFPRRIAPALAKRGDFVGIPDKLFGIRLMVVEGSNVVGPGKHGLERQPRTIATMAWDTMSCLDRQGDE